MEVSNYMTIGSLAETALISAMGSTIIPFGKRQMPNTLRKNLKRPPAFNL